jgi:hypothetical protein
MQAVAQLANFNRTAAKHGMSEEEISELIAYIASNPEAGELIEGTGGCRKLRYARPGMGKRGGYRVITFYASRDIPVFLLSVYAKNKKADLNDEERSALYRAAKAIVAGYRRKPVRRA